MENFYWLNEESRKFLNEGYLLPGVTPEDRIRQIADTAEKILGINGFSDKFYGYMAKGFYSLATPVWMNFGLDRGLPISCVTGDTWINTSTGGKMAKDIKIGDLVLTHKNRFKEIQAIIPTKQKDDIWKLKVGTRMTNLHITGNHPVLTNLGWIKVEDLDKDKHLIAVNGELEYDQSDFTIDLKPFTPYKYTIIDGLICKSIENISEKSKRNNISEEYVTYYSKVPEFIDVDEDLAWALGVWFAEGSISICPKKNPNGIRITVNDKDEAWVAEEWLAIMSKRFNLNGSVYRSEVFRKGKANSWLSVNLNGKIIGEYFKSFGKGAKEKQIPEWLLNLPKEKLRRFLEGMLLGDGSKYKNGSNKLTLSNPELLLQIYNIGLKLGLDMSLQMQDKAGIYASTSHVYTLVFRGYEISLSRNNSRAGIKFNDGLTYCPILTLEKTDKIEDVYDFTVADDHSFSCAGVVVHNCYGIDIQDDTADIVRAAAEIGMLTKHGGGTAGFFGKLRHRGAPIKNNGVSNGPISFMELFQSATNVITQGQARRGYFAAYLNIDHPDIEEFLKCREEGHPIQDIALAVTIPDYWMQEMIDGDKEKRAIMAKVHKKRSETGFPYIFFSDNVDRDKPQVYKDKDLKINHSQMCVTSDQKVVTSKGIITVGDLYKKSEDLILFDNSKLVKSSKMNLIEKDADVFEITLDNGLTHKVTDYHKLKTFSGKNGKGYVFENKMCKDLKIGDKVAIQTKKGLFGSKKFLEEAFLLGLYQADGTQSNGSIHIDIWEKDFDLLNIVESYIKTLHSKYSYKPRYSNKGDRFIPCNTGQSLVKKERLTTQLFKDRLDFEKGYVPNWIFESDEETIWQYIKGLLYADGSAYIADKKKGLIKVDYTSIDIDFLKDLQILFNNLGLNSSINTLRKSKKTSLPNGKGGHSLYNTKECYRLSVNSKKALKEIELKTQFLSRKGIDISLFKEGKNSRITSKITDIKYVGKEDVFCVTVDSDDHYWICNGFITHNCSEIIEYTDDEKTFVCCLSSLNLVHWDEIKETDAIETLTMFLDAVYTEFIEKAEGIPFFEKAVKFAKEHRSIGLGVLGWHSLLQSKMIPFEGMEAMYLNAEIFKTINERSLETSQKLAIFYGEPKMLEGYNERFTTRVAIAPTTSSSFILGQVSPSIEPLHSNYFLKDLAKGKFSYKNPYLEELLKEKGLDTPETWKSIMVKGGSVQHLDSLSQREKDVFKTFGEISQMEIVKQAAQRQKWIDQAQSLNLMIHPDVPLKDVNALLIEAWKLGLKTLYYQRSVNIAQQVSRDILTCASCEA